MKVIGLLLCFLIAFIHVASSSSGIEIDVNSGSGPYWLAIGIQNAALGVQSVQLQQSQSTTWEAMQETSGWGYYTYTARAQIKFPVSIRITSTDGHQVTLPNIITSAAGRTIDTGVQFNTAPTNSPTSAPTRPPTSAPTTKAPTSAPTTKAPTSAPTTKAPTSAPTTKAPTSAPTTKAPTAAPTTGSTGCSGPMKLMVPLYTYPGSTWDTVAASASTVFTVAIINPNSGPGNGPDSTYNTYMPKLKNAGVDMVGYVHTSYGARAIADVKADIDVYASQFPLLVGIFLDEVATASSTLSYYQELYSYIMGMPGWKYDILNPGTVPASGYTAAATQIVTYESAASGFASSQNPSFASCSNKDMFAMITYGATSDSNMETAISAAKSKGYYGWVYVTNTGATGATYNSLPSYYAQMATYIASLN